MLYNINNKVLSSIIVLYLVSNINYYTQATCKNVKKLSIKLLCCKPLIYLYYNTILYLHNILSYLLKIYTLLIYTIISTLICYIIFIIIYFFKLNIVLPYHRIIISFSTCNIIILFLLLYINTNPNTVRHRRRRYIRIKSFADINNQVHT